MDVREQLIRAKNGLTYVNNVLSVGGLELWEAKEYSSLAKEYEDEILYLTNYIAENIN